MLSEAQQGQLCVFSSLERKRETDRAKERKRESIEVFVTPSHTNPNLLLYFSTAKTLQHINQVGKLLAQDIVFCSIFSPEQASCDPFNYFQGDMMLRSMRCQLEVTVSGKACLRLGYACHDSKQ